MAKSKFHKISTERAIDILKYISKQVFPCSEGDKFDIRSYSDKVVSHYLKCNDTFIGQYIKDNFEEGLLQLISFIETSTLDTDEFHVAQQLLSALAEYGYDNDSIILQDKKKTLFRLYVEKVVFREALLSSYTNSLIIRYYQYLRLAQEGVDELNQLEPLVEKMINNVYWDKIEELPLYIEFDYIYPNGKNGDILRYIFEEYGETTEKVGITWHGKIEKKYIDYLSVLYPISDYSGDKVQPLSVDCQFQKTFEHHIPTILNHKLRDLAYKRVNYFQRFSEIQSFISEYMTIQAKNRNDIYSHLILQGIASPKWKSEAQLFALVSSYFPDAIYQYRVDWLLKQSLDIYIPSLMVGIEYQGEQHYEPVEHFGGEEHFKHQQENDRKKKNLCAENGIKLIEWSYTEAITESNLRKYLSEVGIKQ